MAKRVDDTAINNADIKAALRTQLSAYRENKAKVASLRKRLETSTSENEANTSLLLASERYNQARKELLKAKETLKIIKTLKKALEDAEALEDAIIDQLLAAKKALDEMN